MLSPHWPKHTSVAGCPWQHIAAGLINGNGPLTEHSMNDKSDMRTLIFTCDINTVIYGHKGKCNGGSQWELRLKAHRSVIKWLLRWVLASSLLWFHLNSSWWSDPAGSNPLERLRVTADTCFFFSDFVTPTPILHYPLEHTHSVWTQCYTRQISAYQIFAKNKNKKQYRQSLVQKFFLWKNVIPFFI